MYKYKQGAIFLIVCFLVISLGLIGCNKNSKVNTNNNNGDQQVKIKYFTSTAFNRDIANPTWGQSIKWLEYAEQINNIKLDFEVVPATSYKERLQLMLASGDYPDLVYFGSATDNEFIQAVDNGVVVPINKYLKDAQNINQYTLDISIDPMRVHQDENIYGIPVSTLLRADGYAVRKDWLANVGLSIPADGYVTIEEFTEILKRFSNDDPDRNGKKDTYGLSAGLDSEKNFMPHIVSPFGWSGWQKVNGIYEYMDPMYDRERDTYKKLLDYNAMLFKKGLIVPDAPTTSFQGNPSFSKGVAGVSSLFAGHYYSTLKDLKAINPNADIIYVKGIKDLDGKVFNVAGYGTGYYGLFAITKSNKNPEKTIKFLNWTLSDEGWDTIINGMNGITYNIVNGEKQYIEGGHLKLSRTFLRRNNGFEFFLPLTDANAKPYISEMKKNIEDSAKNVILSLDRGYNPPSSLKPALMDAKKALNMTIAKILVGETPVSEYDKALENWYKAGGDEYVKEMNKYIKMMEEKKAEK